MDIRRRDFIDRLQRRSEGIDVGADGAASQALQRQGLTPSALRRIAGADHVISGRQELSRLYDLLAARGGGRVDAAVTAELFRALEGQAATASPTAALPTRAARRSPATTGLFAATGVRRQPGVQSLTAADRQHTPEARTQSLLDRASHAAPSTDPLRVTIGDETLTAGELALMHRRSPARFADFLQRHGIARAELDELVDDALTTGIRPGQTLDLSPGSALSRAYRTSGPNGAVRDGHLDPAPMRARAATHASALDRADLSDQAVQAPGFFQRVGEAILEAVAWIGRLFGADWNPDTATFDGAAGEGFDFAAMGRQHAAGPRARELHALLSVPEGAAQLRTHLLAQRPESATEQQWTRAVDEYIGGLRAGLEAQPESARGPVMSPRQAELTLGYLRANDYSAQAQTDLQLVFAQPEPIRSAALEYLTALPDAERANLRSLLQPPGAEPAADAPDAEWATRGRRQVFHDASRPLAQRVALFEMMRRDGFSHDVSDPRLAAGFDAVRRTDDVPTALRDRYLAAVMAHGFEDAHLASTSVRGLVDLIRDQPEIAEAALRDFEATVGASSEDATRAMAARAFQVRISHPEPSSITRGADQRAVVRAFERQNVSLRRDHGDRSFTISARGGSGANEVSLDRYFSDRAYRQQVLTDLGLDRAAFEGLLRNVQTTLDDGEAGANARTIEGDIRDLRAEIANPATPSARRAEAQAELRTRTFDLAGERPPTNVEIDISAGSATDRLFGLGGGTALATNLARRAVQDSFQTYEARLPGADGPVTVASEDLAQLLADHPTDAGARAAFAEAYPGLDYDETVRLFSALEDLVWQGEVPTLEDGGDPSIDLTGRRAPNRALERLRRAYTDRRAGDRANVPIGDRHRSVIGSRSTATLSPVRDLRPEGRAGAAVGNNWFQYGIFNSSGFDTNTHLDAAARGRFRAAGRVADPAHALGALLDLDTFDERTRIGSTRYRETGMAVGRTADAFLVDPRTGARAEGRDVQLLSFRGQVSGSNERQGFGAGLARVERTFERYGGVPRSNMERYDDATPDQMRAAIRAEILRDPRPADQRTDAAGHTRPRTVVVHYAGHTMSDWDDQVMGMDLRGGQFSPEDVAQLNAFAREHGVNLVWTADACRAGSYAHAARADRIDELRAAGTLPPTVNHLDGLRTALVDRHVALSTVDDLSVAPADRRSSCSDGSCPRPGHGPVNVPSARELAELGRAALEGGPGSQAMRDLEATVQGVLDDDTLDADAKGAFALYLGGIEDTLSHRAALRAGGEVNSLLDHGLIAGTMRWRAGRTFMSGTQGALLDQINAQIRPRMPE